MSDVDTAIALITLSKAKVQLKITDSDTSENVILIDLVNQISAMCNTYVGRQLLSKDYTEYYNGNDRNKLMLKNFPVSAVSKLYISDSERVFDADSEVSVSDDVLINKERGILTLWNDETVFHAGVANIKVVYTAGWTLETVPYDIQNAVRTWLGFEYKRYQKQMYLTQSESKGDLTVSYQVKDMPENVRLILDIHKRPTFGFSDYSHS